MPSLLLVGLLLFVVIFAGCAFPEEAASPLTGPLPLGLDGIPGPGKDTEWPLSEQLGLKTIHLMFPWGESAEGEYYFPKDPAEDLYRVYLTELKRRGYYVQFFCDVVHMDHAHLPAGLEDRGFADPLALARWRAYIEAWVARYGDLVDLICIGNEVDTYFGAMPEQALEDYLVLFKEGAQIIRRLHPDIAVGVTLTAGSVERWWPRFEPFCDVLSATYYMPCRMFGGPATTEGLNPDSPFYFEKTLDAVLKAAGDKPVYLQELGCATHESLGSSPQVQAEFIHKLFAWLERNRGHLLGASWLSLSDWPWEGTKIALEGLLAPELLADETFMHYLTSLGLFTETGDPKPGWTAFTEEAERPHKAPSAPE